MAHYAKVEDGIVTNVLVVPDEHEHDGEAYLNGLGLEGRWIQTSYNTSGGVHAYGGTPLRKNYAGIGFTYDEQLEAFIPPQPFPSWILDTETGLWEPPIPRPEFQEVYHYWDEETLSWVPSIPDYPDYEIE
jgi:hypothetical protein